MISYQDNPYLRSLISSLLFASGLGVLVLLLEFFGLGSWGMLFLLFAGFTALLGAISVFGCIFKRTRQASLRILIFSLIFVIVSITCLKLSWSVRKIAFERLAERSEQLIFAIKKYESENGRPPKNLDLLIPKYLTKYPETGMPAYSEKTLYWYDLGSRNGKPISGLWKFVDGNPGHSILAITVNKTGKIIDASLDRPPKNIENEKFRIEKWRSSQNRIEMVGSLISEPAFKARDFMAVKSILGEPNGTRTLIGAPWELLVECPSGLMNWDVFFYWPTEKYPDSGYGGSIQKISNWAYVHE
jgi:hypothetical protein